MDHERKFAVSATLTTRSISIESQPKKVVVLDGVVVVFVGGGLVVVAIVGFINLT